MFAHALLCSAPLKRLRIDTIKRIAKYHRSLPNHQALHGMPALHGFLCKSTSWEGIVAAAHEPAGPLPPSRAKGLAAVFLLVHYSTTCDASGGASDDVRLLSLLAFRRLHMTIRCPSTVSFRRVDRRCE